MALFKLQTHRQREKLEALYRAYSRMLYGVAFKLLKNREDAEDAVHQTFVSISENISKISAIDCPKTRAYIVTIVENKSIDILRKRKLHPQVPYLDVFQGLTVDYTGDNTLAYCILKLKPEYRTVLLLKYHHGCTIAEIAQIMDIKLSYAYKLEQRAKARLEKLCKEEDLL